MCFFFFYQKSQLPNPLQVLQQGPYGKGCPVTGHVLYISETSHKNFPKYRIFPLLSNTLDKVPSLYVPQR